MTTKFFGQRIKRNEDPRLLAGQALFVDDVQLAGMAHVAFYRSPYAHARIKGIDVSQALARESVYAVYTAADLGDYWQPGPLLVPPPPIEGLVFNERTQVPLAKDKVRQVGELYILCGDSWLYDRLVPFIGEVSGVKMPFLASAAFVPLMKAVMSAVVLVLPVPSVYHPETLAYINRATFWVSHESTKAALGYDPRPAQEGLRETILHEMSKLAIPAP